MLLIWAVKQNKETKRELGPAARFHLFNLKKHQALRKRPGSYRRPFAKTPMLKCDLRDI